MLIKASSFCLSIAEPLPPAVEFGFLLRLRGYRDRLIVVGLRARSGCRRQVVGRRVCVRLDPAVERLGRVRGQHGDDSVGRLREDRPRPGVLDPFRLLLLRDQPVEDGEGDDRKEKPPGDPKHKAQRPVESADLAVEDRVGQANGKQGHDDQRDEEHGGRGGRLRDNLLMDIGSEVGHENRVKVIGGCCGGGP